MFKKLKQFVTSSMRMSHIYQPLMLIELLKSKTGSATAEHIAKKILGYDKSQIEYYTEIVKKMPGTVLTKNRGITALVDGKYSLNGYQNLSQEQITELIELCKLKIHSFEEKRKGAHWDHRKKGRKPISGSIRYKVLKRAKFRCELCGISAVEKALEVDHIIPKNLGGKDDISNYQALCYTCNSQKRDTGNEDFRNLGKVYEERESGCIFCEIESSRIINENRLAYATQDKYPVTEGHTLIIPKRHVKDYFGLFQAETNAINTLVKEEKEKLSKDVSIEGYNLGVNCGEVAGQPVFHCHVHLIPRRKGDVKNPGGGVRHVISGKGDYKVDNLLKAEKL